MVSFHIKLDMSTPIRWLESVIGNGQKRLSDRYRDTMRELDMMALRVIAFLLSLATLVLVIVTIPRIVSIIRSFFSNVSIVTRSIPGSVWPSIMYQLILALWFMINT